MSATETLALENTFIYVIGTENGPKKIGISVSPERRLDEIQVGNHASLSVLWSVPFPAHEVQGVEQNAHRLLKEKRLAGEWFAVSQEEALRAIERARNMPKPKPDPSWAANWSRKIIALPIDMLKEVDDFRFGNRISTETEAIRLLIREGLDALAAKSAKKK